MKEEEYLAGETMTIMIGVIVPEGLRNSHDVALR